MPQDGEFTLLPPGLRLRHCLAAIFIAVFSVYYNSLSNGLVMFDDEVIDYNMQPFASAEPFKIISDNFSYNPVETIRILAAGRHLRDFSIFIDNRLFGGEPWGSHLFNTILHYLAALAAFAAFLLIFKDRAWALIAALLFALHPLQTESVTYIAGRRDILCGGFFLFAFVYGALYLKEGGRRRLLLCVSGWGLAMLSKQSAVILPAALLLYVPLLAAGEGTGIKELLRKNGRARRLIGVMAAGAAIYALAVIYTMINGLITHNDFIPEICWYGGSFTAQYLTIPVISWKAVSLMLFPLNLCADYSYRAIAPVYSALDYRFFIPALGGAALLAAAALNVKKRPFPAFFIFWIAATYLPVMPLFPTLHNREVFAEHWLYLPVFGYAGLIVYAARQLPSALSGFTRTGLVLLLLLFSARTVLRNADWKDAETLWSKTLIRHPLCVRALNNYAVVKTDAGDLKKAEALLKKAVETDPLDPIAVVNLSNISVARGDLKQGRAYLMAAFKSPLLGPHMDKIIPALGTMNFLEGRYVDAMKNFKYSAFRPRLGLYDAYLMTAYAQAAFAAGDAEGAIGYLYKTLAEEPDYVPALKALGFIYFETGRYAEAVGPLEKAVELDPKSAEAEINLALAWTHLKNPQKALRYAVAAAQAAPDIYKSWLTLSAAHRAAGGHARAAGFARKALAMHECPETILELALAQRGLKDWDASFATFEAGLRKFPLDRELLFHYAGTLWETRQDLKAYNVLYNLLMLYPDYAPAINAMDFIRPKTQRQVGVQLP